MITTPTSVIDRETLKDRAPEIAAALDALIDKAIDVGRQGSLAADAFSPRLVEAQQSGAQAVQNLEALILAGLPPLSPTVNQEALETARAAHYSFTGGEYNLVETICRAYHKALPFPSPLPEDFTDEALDVIAAGMRMAKRVGLKYVLIPEKLADFHAASQPKVEAK